jgi:hypothetical protein
MKAPATILLSILCTLVTSVAQAQTEIYFSEYAFQNARMRAMFINGSNPHTLFALPAAQWLPLGMTYSTPTSRLIWMDSAGSSKILSAAIDGTASTTLSPITGFGKGASLDAMGRIYFSTNNMVQRVNANGLGLLTIFTSSSTDSVGAARVDATNGHVYVGAEGQIKRMDLDGTHQKTIVRGMSQARAIGLDVLHGYVYWIDANTISDYIGRARLDGSDFRVLIDNSPGVVGSSGLIDLLVDPVGGKLYFADELTKTISSANLDGSGLAVIYTSPSTVSPSGLVLSTGEPAQALRDCNGNGIADDVDIAGGAPDCDNNGVPDSCQTAPCPQRTFLLDQGSDAANTNGRAIGQPSQWQVFQPFDVPSGGWVMGEIGLDGTTFNYAGSPGLRARLYPDDGTGTRPNETLAIASATLDFRFDTARENWAYAPMSATLPQGRHWVRVEAIQPTLFAGSMNFGFSGLQSKSRGTSGNFTALVGPLAVRIVRGVLCVADVDDGSGSGHSDGGVGIEDLLYYLAIYDAGLLAADVDDGSGTGLPDGGVGIEDLLYFLARYDAGC